MNASYIIGIDIGTGSTKAIAVEGSTVLASAQRFYPSISDGEKSEQDAQAVFDAFQQCIREITVKLQAPPIAISLSAAMHSVIAVDEGGVPLTNALLWSDTRSFEIAERLRSTPLGEIIYLRTGTPLHSMSPLCKIKWLQEAEPEIFAKADKFISIKEYIWYKLFNKFIVDHSLASAMGLFNSLSLQWDEAALSFAGIHSHRLSLPVPVSYSKTNLPPDIAETMGLTSETIFFVGGSDGTLANLGSLCLSGEEASITVGTSAAVRITSKKPVQRFDRMIFNYLLDEKTFVCGGAVNNGGNVFQWLLENIFAHHLSVNNYEQLFALLEETPPGSRGLLFLPYLHGERAPIWDEKSCGAFIGLQSVHTLSYFARAAAEGVCFALLDILSSLEEICGPITELALSGGIVHSAEMMQLLADVTEKKVVVRKAEDASALGAVYLAQKSLGLIADYLSLQKKNLAVFLPRFENSGIYKKLFSLYKNFYPQLKSDLHVLHQLGTETKFPIIK